MFDINKIQSCFSNYIAWRDSINPCDKPLSTDVSTSDSGQYFNDYHPLLTYENIKSIAVNPSRYNFQSWDVAATYNTGDIVIYNTGKYDCYFRSLIDGNTGLEPDSNPNQWVEVDYISDWYKQKTNNSLSVLFNNVANVKKLNHKTKTVLDNFKLFNTEGRIKDTIVKSGRFVGYSVRLDQKENLSLFIKQLGVQFTELQTNLTIYVYHSSQNEPVTTFDLNTTKLKGFEWFSPEIRMDYVNDDIDTGRYYIGYYEDDIVGQAINKRLNFNSPCFGCQGWKYEDYKNLSQFVDIYPISVSSQDIEVGRTMFDVNDVRYTNNTNFGINLSLNIRCDWSDFLCQNRDMFINAYRTQVAYDIMNEMLYSTRDNDLRQKINAAIQGNDAVNGFSQMLQTEIDAINFDMSDLGSPCMPCEKRKGMKQQTA